MIKQLSIFLLNEPNQLADFTKIFLDHNINLRAITVEGTLTHGTIRIIVEHNKTDECEKILKDKNYTVRIEEVIAIKILDKPGELHKIAKLFGDNNINIEYFYSAVLKEHAIIVLKLDDRDIKRALTILEQNNVTLVGSDIF